MYIDNHTLVDAVARNDQYLCYKSPRDPRVLDALQKVDRRRFIPDEQPLNIPIYLIDEEEFARLGIPQGMNLTQLRTSRDAAYIDLPVDIGHRQTCSAPSMVALMADLLDFQPGMSVLEIGTGCGYHAAVTAELVGEVGRVTSIEYIPELAEQAQRNLEAHFASSTSSRVRVICGDGSCGFPLAAPYDRIYFTAGAGIFYKFDDPALVEQLTAIGMMLIPQHEGALVKLQRVPDGRDIEQIGYFNFVPLQKGGR